MSQAKAGDKVKVHYTGKLENGDVFDSSQGREPLEFTLGQGMVIPGFDEGISGMEVGQKKSLTIEPAQAYGDRREDLEVMIKKNVIPEDIDPKVGLQLQMQNPDGQMINVVITEVNDDDVKLDANHPLAGKTLIFDVELVEIAA